MNVEFWIICSTNSNDTLILNIKEMVNNMYTGLLIAESLTDSHLLSDPQITVTRQETWDVDDRAVDWQPQTWTAIYIEGNEKDLTAVADLVSLSIMERWYANLSDNDNEYVVFQGRIFKYSKGDAATKRKAQKYAIAQGVPEHQVDW